MTHPDEPDSFRSRRRRLRIAAVLFGLLVGGVAALLLLQLRTYLFPSTQWIYLYEEGHEKTGHRYIHDELLGWRNIPNWEGTTFERPLSINSHGHRDTEHSITKPAGVRRILLLGDSYAWGYGVSNEEMFSQLLEADLTAFQPTEIINTAVSGWGTDQQYLYLTHHGFQYQPDVVVVSFFFGNDFREISSSQQYQLDKPVFTDLRLTLGNVPVPKPRPSDPHPEILSGADSFELGLAILHRMAIDCSEHNCKLVVFKFGTYLDPETQAQFDTTMPEPKRRSLAEMAYRSDLFAKAVQHIPNFYYLDLDEAFREKQYTFAELGVIKSRDYHWNAFGHRQVADLLQRYLVDQQLVDTAGSPPP